MGVHIGTTASPNYSCDWSPELTPGGIKEPGPRTPTERSPFQQMEAPGWGGEEALGGSGLRTRKGATIPWCSKT